MKREYLTVKGKTIIEATKTTTSARDWMDGEMGIQKTVTDLEPETRLPLVLGRELRLLLR
jgi:hypothetical protein